MKNTVIFDLDGLLIDSEIISFRLYEELTGKYGRSMTLEEYATDYSGKIRHYKYEAAAGKVSASKSRSMLEWLSWMRGKKNI